LAQISRFAELMPGSVPELGSAKRRRHQGSRWHCR